MDYLEKSWTIVEHHSVFIYATAIPFVIHHFPSMETRRRVYVLNRRNTKAFQLMLVSHWLVQVPIKLACLSYTMKDNGRGTMNCQVTQENQDVKNVLTSSHFCVKLSLTCSLFRPLSTSPYSCSRIRFQSFSKTIRYVFIHVSTNTGITLTQ